MNQEDVIQQLLQKAGAGGLKNLAAAFVKAWAEVGAVVKKDANNPHYGNDYATLEAVLTRGKPILAKYDLALLQAPGEIDDRGNVAVMGLLIHSSGESISFKTMVPLGGKVTAQAAGSAITYGRRYQAQAVFGVAPADDDGEAASQPSKPAKASEGKATSTPNTNALRERIESFAGTVEELEAQVRPEVEELGDAAINKLYVAKRRELKGKK